MRLGIELRGLALHGFHGVLEEERREGQRFLVDVDADYADARAARTDLLADAVDYRALAALVQEVSDERPHDLLESFAAAVADALLARFPLSRVRVRVHKPDVRLDPPVAEAAVVVERVSGAP